MNSLESKKIEETRRFALRFYRDMAHPETVRSSASMIFGSLSSLHNLGKKEGLLLEAAALLHDIGLGRGARGHHKIARDIILDSRELPFDKDELLIIALLARYHRKALPKKKHRYFGELSLHAQGIVKKLAAILRVADGFDRSHRGLVEDIACVVSIDCVEMKIMAKADLNEDCQSGILKSDLFEEVFKKKIKVSWHVF